MELLRGIRNIIFDLGGVVINIDYHKTLKALENLGFKEIEKSYTQLSQEVWFDLFEVGKLSSVEFIERVSSYLPQTVNRDQVIQAWNAMLLDFPPERAEILLNLGKKYRLFLLSNTNELHIGYYLPKVKEWFGRGLDDFFEKVYYSHQLGLRKPDPRIFRHVLKENEILPGETLFIDDSPQHIEGALNAGINAYHLKPPQSIPDLFRAYLK